MRRSELFVLRLTIVQLEELILLDRDVWVVMIDIHELMKSTQAMQIMMHGHLCVIS